MKPAWFGVPLLAGCAGPSYGHSRVYQLADGEMAAVSGARLYDASLVSPGGDDSAKGRVVVFGVVESRSAGPSGQALLKLSVRTLEPRNICATTGDDESCRVTVSDKDAGAVWALVRLRADDDIGPRAVGQRSLLRLAGTIGQDVSPVDGGPIVHATFYRQWPSTQYLTPARAGEIR
jgi:hypothetical protein